MKAIRSRLAIKPLGFLVGLFLMAPSKGQDNVIAIHPNGWVGITLAKQKNEYPTIIGLAPEANIPSDVQVGDQLIATGLCDNDTTYISVRNLTLQEVANRLRGSVASTVGIRCRRQTLQGYQDYTVCLPRIALRSTVAAKEGSATWTNPVPGSLRILSEFSRTVATTQGGQTSDRPHVQPSYESWAKITNGMSSAEVVSAIGSPLVTQGTGTSNATIVWIYGWIRFDGKAFPIPYYFRVYLLNDKVIVKEDPFGSVFSIDGKPTKPSLVTPPGDQRFEHYPRFLDFRWNPSSGEYPIEYLLEVGTLTSSGWQHDTIRATECYSCIAFVGMNKGRWRVKAINALGESEWSDYRFFEFRN